MVAGDTAVDNTNTGYITREQITLSVTPTAATHLWALAKPSGSTARADLDRNNQATALFTPDVEGFYTITFVDGATTYVLRLDVANQAPTVISGALRFLSRLGSTITVAATGLSVYFDTTFGVLRSKDTSGNLRELTQPLITATVPVIAAHTATVGELVTYDPTAGTFTITAPASPTAGDGFGIINETSNTTLVTVAGNSNNIGDPGNATPGTPVSSFTYAVAFGYIFWRFTGGDWRIVSHGP